MSTQPENADWLARLRQLDAKRERYSKLPARSVESLADRLRIELTYTSNALEGNTLSLRETELLVVDGLVPSSGKSLREIYETRNHHAAIQQVERWVAERKPITARAVLELHGIIMREIDAQWAGRLRNGPVFIRGTRHLPPNAALVSEELDKWILRLDAHSNEHPIERAERAHWEFESLHPFFDGNGRTGRSILNWQLLAAGFPLTPIRVEDRERYLDSFEKGHAGEIGAMRTLVADSAERVLDIALT